MKKPLPKRIVFFASIFLAIILILIFIRGALFPIAFSLFLAYLLDPAADFLESKKIPRVLAALLLLLVAGSLLVLAVLVLVPILQKELQKLIESIPQIIAAIEKNIFPLVEKYLRRKIPGTFQGVFNEAVKAAAGIDMEDVKPVAKIIAGAFSGLIGVLTALLALILIPVLTFFFLRDFDTITLRIAALFPRDVKPWLVARFRDVDEVLGGFVRGQLTVCLIMATLYSIGLSVIGVDLAVLIGTIGGLGLIVPFVGAAIACFMAMVMSLATFGLDIHILYILGWWGFVHLWEAYLFTPTIVGHRVGLSPLGVILSLYIGGEALGGIGLLLAIPTIAVLKVFLRAGLEYYLSSSYYLGR